MPWIRQRRAAALTLTGLAVVAAFAYLLAAAPGATVPSSAPPTGPSASAGVADPTQPDSSADPGTTDGVAPTIGPTASPTPTSGDKPGSGDRHRPGRRRSVEPRHPGRLLRRCPARGRGPDPRRHGHRRGHQPLGRRHRPPRAQHRPGAPGPAEAGRRHGRRIEGHPGHRRPDRRRPAGRRAARWRDRDPGDPVLGHAPVRGRRIRLAAHARERRRRPVPLDPVGQPQDAVQPPQPWRSVRDPGEPAGHGPPGDRCPDGRGHDGGRDVRPATTAGPGHSTPSTSGTSRWQPPRTIERHGRTWAARRSAS